MNNKINKNKIIGANFQGVKLKGKDIKNMDELIKKMVADLLKRAEREVSEYGDFGVNNTVYEQFHNPDQKLLATDFMLKITKPSNAVEGHEKKRYLELVAYNLPSPYISEKVIGHGTKDDILNKLRQDNICDFIKEQLIKLSKDLEDV